MNNIERELTEVIQTETMRSYLLKVTDFAVHDSKQMRARKSLMKEAIMNANFEQLKDMYAIAQKAEQ